MSNIFSDLLSGLDPQNESLNRSAFAARYLLHPQIPRAIKDDPDGSFHFGLQITDPDGNPLKGLRKGDPIPLYLRWYQKEFIDEMSRFRVLRMGRRVGKTFSMAVEIVAEALTKPNAKILVLTPNESHIKVIFDDYVRPLFKTYRHRKSGRIGLPHTLGDVPSDCDFAIVRDTQKPQEIVITDGKEHNVTIRGMVISPSARGQSSTFLVFDEADYADTEDVRKIVAPIIMTMPDTRILMSSTPTGRRDSFYYEKCHDSRWKHFHRTFKVLPHYNDELHDEMASMAGGENTNTFKQEYLAEFGSQTEGVFDQKALNKSFIISPYVQVLEEINPRTRERTPLLAATETRSDTKLVANYEAVKPVSYGLSENPIGSESIYRPEYRGCGVVTAGTDWNDVAGMQTVLIWWPPKVWLQEGRIRVSRFRYDGTEPVTTDRAKDNGRPVNYIVGSDNNDPGGVGDLSQIKGIVIWHGRLESGQFTWQSAANRVLGMMAIPDFIDAWYVDQGYGEQVNQMILEGMTSGYYQSDGGNLLSKPRPIEENLLRHIRRFHPEEDSAETGKIYRTIQFNKPFEHRDIDFKKRGDHYKDVMVGVAKRMIAAGELLIPYGELVGYHKPETLGNRYQEELDTRTGQVHEVAIPVTDRDRIEENGAAPARGDRGFGGLVTQMREWRVDGYSPTGKPRYAGADHAIDAFMLAVLAWWEQFSDEKVGNIFRRPARLDTEVADDLFDAADAATRNTRRHKIKTQTQSNDAFQHKNYKSERAPLDEIRNGADPKSVGTSLTDMIKMARNHWRSS